MSEQTLAPVGITWHDLAVQSQAGEIHEALMPHLNRLLAENGVEPVASSAPGAELVNGSIESASNVADKVVEATGTEDVGVVNDALSHVAEASSQHNDEKAAEKSLLDALIIGAEEDLKAPHNPIDIVVKDSIVRHEDVTHAVETVADSGAIDVAENMAFRIDEAGSHRHFSEEFSKKVNQLGMRSVENTQEEASIRNYLGLSIEDGNIKAVTLPGKEQVSQAIKEEAESWNDPRRAWQERVFGKAELDDLRQDTIAHFEKPVAERKGELIIVNGQEKRPIMDISLDLAAKAEVQTMLEQRARGMSSVVAKLEDLQKTGAKIPSDELKELLYESEVWTRPQGNLFGYGAERDNSGGTVADLYIDSGDLQQYQRLDQLIQQTADYGFKVPSQDQIANRVLQLASNSFPSGVELMHAIRVSTLPDLLDHGALATRSQRKHGQHTDNNSLNGAFIHMAGPGGVAQEYGDSLVAGIPIDTIVRHSPYLQLEDGYTGNETPNGGSMQYHMQPMMLNNVNEAPLAFRAALESLHTRIAEGLRIINIGQGTYDNWSFSAGDTVDTAGQYSYPITELSLYATPKALSPLSLNNGATHNKLFAERSTIICAADWDSKDFLAQQGEDSRLMGGMNAILFNAAPLPNFTLNEQGGVMLYAPTASKEVSFRESGLIDQKKLAFTLDNIKPETIPRYLDGMIADGMTPTDAFQVALDSVNTKGGSAREIVSSYIGGLPTLVEAGISPTQLMGGLSDEVIKNNGSQLLAQIANLSDESLRGDPSQINASGRQYYYKSWQYLGGYASPETKVSIIKPLGDRLYTVDPEIFTRNLNTLEQNGYVLTDAQKQVVQEIESRNKLRANQKFEIPYIDMN